MLSKRPISADSPTEAWQAVMEKLLMAPGGELGLVLVDIKVPPLEQLRQFRSDPLVQRISSSLRSDRRPDVAAVASTIFPLSMWRTGLPDSATDLYARYRRLWPRLRRRCPANRRGTYFQRLMGFRPGSAGEIGSINQLKHIVDTYKKGNHRRSALVATTFDPSVDHVDSRRLGFPCLHQVGILPSGTKSAISVVGYYTMQHHYERALGNYIGLCGLAHFIGAQIDMPPERVQCVTSVLQLGGTSKAKIRQQHLF